MAIDPLPAPRVAQAPARFLHYRLEEVLGRGGMGVVYAAHDELHDRRVALKVLAPALADDARYRARFLREARTIAGLSSPHVVPIHTFGTSGDQLYLDMALVEGRDLAAVLSGGALEAERAVAIVEQVADALDAAHAKGLVHRDVKPANVLLSARRGGQDFAYLADFGLARSATPDGITSTGTLLGTVAYMSPEQVEARPATHLSDVYSLGCVLYHCLAGRLPFWHTSEAHLMDAHRWAAPPPLPGDGILNALDPVIATAMAKDPAQRYPSAGAMARAARAALTGLARTGPRTEAAPPPDERETAYRLPAPATARTTPVAPARRRWWRHPAVIVPAAVVAAVVALFGVLVLYFFLTGTGSDDASSSSASARPSVRPSAPSSVSSSASASASTTAPPSTPGAELREDLPEDLTDCAAGDITPQGGFTPTAALSCSATHLPGGIVNAYRFTDEASRDAAFANYTDLSSDTAGPCPTLGGSGTWKDASGAVAGTAACYTFSDADTDGTTTAEMVWTASGTLDFFTVWVAGQASMTPGYTWWQQH